MSFLMAMLMQAAYQPVIPANHTPCVAQYVAEKDVKREVRRLKRQGYLVTVNGKAQTVLPIYPRTELMRARVVKSGC